MSIINKTAVLIPFSDLTAKEHSDRLTAIDAHVASTLATQKSEVAAAIAQVNLTQSQTITALTLEVSNLTNSITATQTDLINRADQLAQEVTDITVQLTKDKAAFTQDIQDALDDLKDGAYEASALRTPRKIQGVDFDGTQDISLPVFSTQIDGLVPKRIGATADNYLREDGTWVVPPDTTYALLTKASAEEGTATTANTISAKVLKDAIKFHVSTVTDIVGNAGTATKLQTPRTINGVLFDGTQDILLPESAEYSMPVATASVLGGIKVGSGLAISNSVLSVGTLNQSTTGNAATATKLQTARTISLTGKVTGSVSFDGSNDASISTAITGLGVANGIATLDSNGQVPSTQLPSYVDDVLEYTNVAAFPATGETGKIYVETTGNITYRWSGTAYVKITSGDVSSVAGKTGVVTLSKADVGLTNVDNTADSSKSVASASKLTTAHTIGGVSFNGSANINLPGVNIIGNQNTTGNAATASKLATPVQINGVNFDGSTGFDIPKFTASKSGVVPAAGSDTTNYLRSDGTWAIPTDTQYTAMTATAANAGTDATAQVISPRVLKQAIQTHAPAAGGGGGGGMNFAAKIEIELEIILDFSSGDYRTIGNIISVSNQANIASAVMDSNGILCLTFNTPISNPNLIVTTKNEVKTVTYGGVKYNYLASAPNSNFKYSMNQYSTYGIFQYAEGGYVNTNTKLYISCNLRVSPTNGGILTIRSNFPAIFNLGIIDA